MVRGGSRRKLVSVGGCKCHDSTAGTQANKENGGGGVPQISKV